MKNHNDEFLEHLTDHLIIALSFFLMGFLYARIYWSRLHDRKFKIDQDLEKGTIMRLFTKSGNKWIIANPANFIQWIDIALLCYIDKGKSDYVDSHSKRRARIISVTILALAIVFSLSGVLLILSAFERDMNPFNYIFQLSTLRL